MGFCVERAERGQQLAGLSDRIEIESYLVIELNVLAQIESTCMQIESKVFFDF